MNASSTKETLIIFLSTYGQEHTVFGDAGYQGTEKHPENQGTTVEWLVAMELNVRNALPTDELGRLQDRFEKLKANIQARVELA